MAITIFYHPDGKIQSMVRGKKPTRLSEALREQGLKRYVVPPSIEDGEFSYAWKSLLLEDDAVVGHDDRRFGVLSSIADPQTVNVSGKPHILMVSSKGACGIAEYTRTLVQHLSHNTSIVTPEELTQPDLKASLVHLQYEPNLYDRESLLAWLKQQRVPVILTAHYYDQWVANAYLPYLQRVITHNPDLPYDDKHLYIVQGCPVFEEQDADAMRKRHGLPVEARILTGFGFIMPWKQQDYFFCGYLARAMQQHEDLFVQLLHARYPKFPGLAERVIENVQDAIHEFGLSDRVFACWDFLSKDEINERLQASDLGYIWGRAESRGSSATTKEYIAGRCPIIVPESAHYADLDRGLLKVPPADPQGFLDVLLRVVRDEDLLARLKEEQRQNYAEHNYREVAEKHREVYTSCLKGKQSQLGS